MAEEEKLKSGQIVRLKSGGPKMTVESYKTGDARPLVKCTWFDNEMKLKYNTFHQETLDVID